MNGVQGDTVSLDAGDVRCRWVIGADGQNSRVRHWADLNAARHESTRVGFRQHYQMAPWTDHMEIYWGPGCQMYVTPVSPREVCVAVLSRDAHLRFDGALTRFPGLGGRLAHASATTLERGSVTASRRLRRSLRPAHCFDRRCFRLGGRDHGRRACSSFHQALALADALGDENLEAYQAAHRRLMRRPAFMAGLMLSLDRLPWLRPLALRGMAFEPAIFEKLLAGHVGAESEVLAVS